MLMNEVKFVLHSPYMALAWIMVILDLYNETFSFFDRILFYICMRNHPQISVPYDHTYLFFSQVCKSPELALPQTAGFQDCPRVSHPGLEAEVQQG